MPSPAVVSCCAGTSCNGDNYRGISLVNMIPSLLRTISNVLTVLFVMCRTLASRRMLSDAALAQSPSRWVNINLRMRDIHTIRVIIRFWLLNNDKRIETQLLLCSRSNLLVRNWFSAFSVNTLRIVFTICNKSDGFNFFPYEWQNTFYCLLSHTYVRTYVAYTQFLRTK